MQMKTTDPIVSEVRAARDKHAAQFGYDLKDIFRDVRARQEASGRSYVKYPSHPAGVQQPLYPVKSGMTRE